MTRKQIYNAKVRACEYLASLDKKHITEKDVLSAAKKVNLKFSMVQRAWDNVLKFGKPDRRVKSGKYFGVSQFVVNSKTPYYPRKNYSKKFIVKVMREYIVNKQSHKDLISKYQINSNQFYEWVDELNVTGKIPGYKKPLLDWSQYAKFDIKQTRRNKLDVNLKRLRVVFKNYTK